MRITCARVWRVYDTVATRPTAVPTPLHVVFFGGVGARIRVLSQPVCPHPVDVDAQCAAPDFPSHVPGL
ncbi:hypothetical protein DICSQDRAFT_172590 [Dichomitus squalens LYAD-421 SS1]|uniref:Uncharacterized protein n=1 Tax=Dichomitus squalens (strain LYAD-421) TaxID=732165 RepID=R7SUX2_DICSQ|nr:uncharacterized protein DICSQDRAFT_172590 [Dichomitus squalens LYAD-421 SS1]EJF58762.1 hypothetical protein DICSQDRAFT_172590 [Dichomitus squalens LYAD-421 SS1]